MVIHLEHESEISASDRYQNLPFIPATAGDHAAPKFKGITECLLGGNCFSLGID